MSSLPLVRLTRDLREMFNEMVEHRELLYRMTMRDLLLRYKQTVMGFGWAVFMPLVNTAVFSVIFTRIAPIDTGIPYPLFAFCGLLTWNFTAASLRFAVNSLTSNTALVTKVYFPREVFPISAVLVSLVDFAVGALVLVGMMIYYHVGVGPTLAVLPVVLAIQVAFTSGMALLLAMANLFYRDVKYLFEVAITVWMFLTSVLYPLTLVQGRLRLVMLLNPMTPIIDAYRSVILFNRFPDATPLVGAGVLSFVLFGLGWLLFHRAEYQFAERV